MCGDRQEHIQQRARRHQISKLFSSLSLVEVLCGIYNILKHAIVDCPDLQDSRRKYFTAFSLKDIFRQSTIKTSFILLKILIFTVLHWVQDGLVSRKVSICHLSACLSISPSVKHMHCDKTAVFGVKLHFAWRKFVCVKTVSDKVVRHLMT